MKVKCINSAGFEDALTLNNEYEVLDQDTIARTYKIVCDTGTKKWLRQTRFSIVNTTISTHKHIVGKVCPLDVDCDTVRCQHARDNHKNQSAINKSNPVNNIVNDDKEEARLWKALSPTILPGHCNCGIHRSQCVYHR